MKPINEITKHAINGMNSTTPISTGNRGAGLTDQDKRVVNAAFERLVVIYPAWRNAVDGDADQWSRRYKRELGAALVEASVTEGEQIEAGVKMARSVDCAFLPNPGTFARWCKPVAVPYHREFVEPNAAERKQIEQQVSSQSVRDAAFAKMRATLAEAR